MSAKTDNIEAITEQSWIDIPRNYILESDTFDGYNQKILLTDEFTKQETPKSFKTQLLPHQKNTVRAMIDLEQRRYIELNVGDTAFEKYKAESCAGILSEPPSSGKTYEILATIILNPIPRKISEITSVGFPKAHMVNNREYRNRNEFVNAGFGIAVRKTYHEKTFRQTFIFVGKSVLSPWFEKIKYSTNLKVLVVEDCHKLTNFYNLVFNPETNNLKEFNTYDIVLIKNGIVSGKFDVPELSDSLRLIKSKSMVAIFGDLFKKHSVARVVLDDFDVLNIPSVATVIPALFTWFVSATRKAPLSKKYVPTYHTIEDILINSRPIYTSVWSNKELYSFFNIGCEESYISESIKASKICYQMYKFINPNETYIAAIGAIGTDDAREIMEMLNADADTVAAKKAGCKSNNVPDIFERVLDKKWHSYKKNIEIEKYIPQVQIMVQALEILPDIKSTISETNLTNLRKNLTKPGPHNQLHKIMKYQQNSITDVIRDVKDQNQRDKDENGKAIQRVKDNLRQGECPITCEKLTDVDTIVIMKCCGVIISGEVVSWALKISKQKEDINGMCPNCRHIVRMDNIILIDREINIDKILNDDILDTDEPMTELEAESAEPISVPDDENNPTKLNCIIKIIKGDEETFSKFKDASHKDILIPGLLEGSADLGIAPGDERKIIVYSNYNESMIKIEKKMQDHNIPYERLQGQYSNINDVVFRYKLPNSDPNSLKVLLISGPQYSAGLDLENTTDVIFTHNVIDVNIKTQLAGRAARYGRKYNLYIHMILYNNEYHHMMSGEI